MRTALKLLLTVAALCWLVAATPTGVVGKGMRVYFGPLDTCSVTIEGTQELDSLSGAATGKQTKLCLCVSNGSSSYAWRNLVTGTLGTTTTCGTE